MQQIVFLRAQVDQHRLEDAKKVILTSKYPPIGRRSTTTGLPHFNYMPLPASVTVPELNESGSVFFLMIEAIDALEAVNEIASLPGCGVLLVGSNDLATEIGIKGDSNHPKFMQSLEMVAARPRNTTKSLQLQVCITDQT